MNSVNPFAGIPLVLLCGGKGIVLEQAAGETRINKALVRIHGQALFVWNLRHYAAHGVRDFILATGFQHEDFTQVLMQEMSACTSPSDPTLFQLQLLDQACTVRLVQTPIEADTAQRLLACRPWLPKTGKFCLSYSDTLADINLSAELQFHQKSRVLATLIAAEMPVRFRVLGQRQGEYLVRGFAAKPVIQTVPINGGFYIFDAAFLAGPYLQGQVDSLEKQPLERLVAELQLAAFEHRGLWQHLDCERDIEPLNTVARYLEKLHRPQS